MTGSTLPQFHIRPPRGWLNDPNGVALADGRHHVFFQHHPTSVDHHAIHWGHASSTDLVHWREEPIALEPRPGEPDAFGCWTGCAVLDDGVWTLAYSAVADDTGRADVLLATSTDWQHWTQQHEPVLPMPDLPGITDVRDPFVFSAHGHRWLIQGAGSRAGGARILLWQVDDLAHPVPAGTLVDDTDPVLAEAAAAQIWECPNLVQVDGRWVLVVSLWRWSESGHDLAGVRWAVGDLVPSDGGLAFTATAAGVLDEGPAFYAPQLLATPDRVLVWGWAWELGRSRQQLDDQGWQGILTAPRELALVDGRVVQRLVPEIADRITDAAVDLARDPICFAVRATAAAQLRCGEDLVAELPAGSTTLVDASLVEVFGADGRTWTTRGYPTPTAGWSLAGSATAVGIDLD